MPKAILIVIGILFIISCIIPFIAYAEEKNPKKKDKSLILMGVILIAIGVFFIVVAL